MIGTWLSCLIARQTSLPEMPGNIKSSTITSNSPVLARSTPSDPVAATVTALALLLGFPAAYVLARMKKPQASHYPQLFAGRQKLSLFAQALLADAMFVGGKAAIMVRKGEEAFVVGAFCSHYHGPLAEGLVIGVPRGGIVVAAGLPQPGALALDRPGRGRSARPGRW